MPSIKSLEDLKAIRDKHKGDIDMRNLGESENKVRISVGMATCGIASGARETINAIVDEIKKEALNSVAVVQTGCMGHCYAEPIIEVRIPNKPPILYGKVDTERGREIVRRHIKNGEIINEWVIERTGC